MTPLFFQEICSSQELSCVFLRFLIIILAVLGFWFGLYLLNQPHELKREESLERDEERLAQRRKEEVERLEKLSLKERLEEI